jgi:maltooligosyltrehalose trehalohydrolase
MHADPTHLEPLGATLLSGDGVRFRVWAPKAATVEVELSDSKTPAHYPLSPIGDGYFAGVVEAARAGSRYKFRLDGDQSYPDPASRSQPDDVHGPSEVIDPAAFHWADRAWAGLARDDSALTIYELHVGTFSRDGTFEGVVEQLPYLKELGVSAIELMPVAEFPGSRNWGYDGVDLFAPESSYGGPDGLKRLVDAAHRVGLGVFLDVVYNHFGPDGNYLGVYSDDYFTDRYDTPWGQAVNYDGPNSEHVRRLILQNVRSWLDEFHVDGLRLDATHAIHDQSPRHPTIANGRRSSSPKTTATRSGCSIRPSGTATGSTGSGPTISTTLCAPT